MRRVARTIPLFVVVMRHINRFVQVFRINGIASIFEHLHQDLPAFGRMALHDGKFFIGEFARLVQNQVGHGNLTDVVQRGGTFQLFNVGIREHVHKLAFGLELASNRFHVFGGLLNMVACTLVARFNHFSEFHNNDFLHSLDSFVLRLHSLNKVIGIDRHRVHGFVQMLNFIIGVHPDFPEAFYTITNALEVHRFGFKRTGTRRIGGNLHGSHGHLVHGNHSAALHQFKHDTHDDNGKAKEQRKHLDKEGGFVANDIFHRNIRSHIGHSPVRRIADRFVNGQQPAKLVVRNNRINFAASQKRRQIRFKARVELHHIARFTPRFTIGIQIEHHMATVRLNLVHIQVLGLREAFPNRLQHRPDKSIVIDFVTSGNVIINLFGVNCRHRSPGHTRCNTDKVLDGIFSIQEKADRTGEAAQKHFGHDHHVHHLAQQGCADFLLHVIVSIDSQEHPVQVVLNSTGNKAENKHREYNDNTLVKEVENNVGPKLRSKLAPSKHLVERNRERSRNAFAKIEPVQEVGKDRADTAANQGKRKNHDKQARDVLEKSLVVKEGRQCRNKNTDHPVEHGHGVRNAVNRIRGKTDYDCRQVSAKHSGNDGTQAIQVKRQMEGERHFCR